jgi:hypothetical protein
MISSIIWRRTSLGDALSAAIQRKRPSHIHVKVSPSQAAEIRPEMLIAVIGDGQDGRFTYVVVLHLDGDQDHSQQGNGNPHPL